MSSATDLPFGGRLLLRAVFVFFALYLFSISFDAIYDLPSPMIVGEFGEGSGPFGTFPMWKSPAQRWALGVLFFLAGVASIYMALRTGRRSPPSE